MSARTKSIAKAKDATLQRIAKEKGHPQQDEAAAELKRREEALSESEFSSDPQVAAKAIESKRTEKKAPAARTSEATIQRAVELRSEGLGLVRITKKLTEEGHKSATGKELRPQTVRQLLLRALNTDHLREAKPADEEVPVVDIEETLKADVEAAKESKRRERIAEEIGIRVEQ